jgi:hypothetical protein
MRDPFLLVIPANIMKQGASIPKKQEACLSIPSVQNTSESKEDKQIKKLTKLLEKEKTKNHKLKYKVINAQKKEKEQRIQAKDL